MKDIYKCIVKNDIYEVSTFQDKAPDNTVLTAPNGKDKIYKYNLINGVNCRMSLGSAYPKGKLRLYYKDVLLYESPNSNFQSFADFLNKYATYSETDLKKLQAECLDSIIGELELEINELLEKKETLKNEVEVLLEINNKINEIKDLGLKL